MAEAVVGKSGDDMKMGVVDDLAGGAVVVHNYIHSVGVNSAFYGNGDFFDDRADVADNFIRQTYKYSRNDFSVLSKHARDCWDLYLRKAKNFSSS